MPTYIRPSNHLLGSILVGEFPNLVGKVWFNPHSIVVCHVTMDTADKPAMIVHQLDGSAMKFIEHDCG